MEPEWVDVKRRQDVNLSYKYITTPWTHAEDERLRFLLKKRKYGYMELSKMLRRTCGAIQRRICDLNIEYRPVKADNHKLWSEIEYSQLCEMIKSGCKYEYISEIINRSTKAIRGRVFDMYLTENLDKVRKYIGDGNWGDGRPELPIRYKRLMLDKQKVLANELLSQLAFNIREHAKQISNVEDEYINYWQKDMCMNWDTIIGCTASEKDCDTCTSFVRIKPQYCKRCGKTFYDRVEYDFCTNCRHERKILAYKRYLRSKRNGN